MAASSEEHAAAAAKTRARNAGGACANEVILYEAVGSSRTGEDREADALVTQIAELRARIEEERERRTGARAASEDEEMAALRERIAVARAFVAKQSNSAASVEKQARRARLLTGIALSVLGAVLVAWIWSIEHQRTTAEEGLGSLYLIFGIPSLIGLAMIVQSRYSAFRNGSLDAEDS